MGRNKDWTCTGREVQFLALTLRGQEVTASGLEDWPVGDWLVLRWVGWKLGREMVEVDAAHWETPWLLTPDFEMTFFLFWCQFPIFIDLMDQRKDASLLSKADLCSFSKSFFFNRYNLQVL